jgi:hypothetical protein
MILISARRGIMGSILSTKLNLPGLVGSGQAGPWKEFPAAEARVAVYGGLARLALVLAACCLLSQSMAAAPAKEVRRVLILHSLGFSSPASIRVDEEIRAALDNSPYQIELYEETLQGILFSDPAEQKEARLWLIRK